MFPGVRQQYYKFKSSCGFKLQNNLTTAGRRLYQCMNSNVRCSAEDGSLDKDSNVASSNISLYDAQVLYCVAPAMGHNKVCYPFFFHMLCLFHIAILLISTNLDACLSVNFFTLCSRYMQNVMELLVIFQIALWYDLIQPMAYILCILCHLLVFFDSIMVIYL